MNTIHHGFWTYFIFRKQKHLVKYFVFGSISPDIIYYIMFLYMAIRYPIEENSFELHSIVHQMFDHPIVIVLRQLGHSIIVWLILMIITILLTKWKLSPWKALLYGWLGHILIDLLTHVRDAVPILYPLNDYIIRGPISYWDPDFYGREFSIIHSIFFLGAIIYLIIERVRAKKVKKKKDI